MKNLRSWKLLLPLAGLATVASIWVSGAFAAPQSHTIRVAIMTDCKGALRSATRSTSAVPRQPSRSTRAAR